MNFEGDTREWISAAGDGPILRGRRADAPAPTINFLSGNGFCGGVYWPFLRRFMPEYGLFLHDIEGQGRSDPPARFSGVKNLVRRIPQVLAEQNLPSDRPLIGMGHSFGAALTLRVATANPELFDALVLLDPILFPGTMRRVLIAAGRIGLHPFARAAQRRRNGWPTRGAALEHLRGRGIYSGWSDEALACFVDQAMGPQDGQWRLRCPPWLEAQIFRHPPGGLWTSVRRVRVPVLIVYGDKSYSFLPGAVRRAARSNPRIETLALPGAHCFMLEDSTGAHRAVQAFLQRALRTEGRGAQADAAA